MHDEGPDITCVSGPGVGGAVGGVEVVVESLGQDGVFAALLGVAALHAFIEPGEGVGLLTLGVADPADLRVVPLLALLEPSLPGSDVAHGLVNGCELVAQVRVLRVGVLVGGLLARFACVAPDPVQLDLPEDRDQDHARRRDELDHDRVAHRSA